ncbi:MAG: hypothetical protein ACLTX6_02150 [Lachnospiraceae bacterium]
MAPTASALRTTLAIEQGNCSNSIASGWYPIAAHQINLTLATGRM